MGAEGRVGKLPAIRIYDRLVITARIETANDLFFTVKEITYNFEDYKDLNIREIYKKAQDHCEALEKQLPNDLKGDFRVMDGIMLNEKDIKSSFTYMRFYREDEYNKNYGADISNLFKYETVLNIDEHFPRDYVKFKYLKPIK